MSKNFNSYIFNKFNKAIAYPLIFLLLSAVLIFCWFRFGHIYGGGDTGIPTYNPKVMVTIASNIWWDSLAPGIPVAQGLTSVPMLFFLSIPQSLGASPPVIQALLFFTLLFLMGYGMYLLALSIFGRSKLLLAISAGIFYMFNPYMMIQIWHRFIHNSMFLVAFLPFLIMTWLLWIKKRNYMYLLLFLLVNLLAVYVFGTIAFIVAIWTLVSLLTLLEILIPWKGKRITFKIFLAFLVGFIFWILTNSWWLMPTFSVNPALLAAQHSTDDSLSTLLSLSEQTILPYTLRLINPFYLYWNADWGNIYKGMPLVFISWLFVPVAFIGFVAGLKQKSNAVWSLLFLVIIFLSKGAAPPFNFPYIFGFSHFFPLGVIRNPFEKLGILLPFVYALVFTLGLQVILIVLNKYIGKFKTYIVLLIFICLHMAFFYPMFTGKVFGTLDKSTFVDVPKTYTEANDWLKQDTAFGSATEGKILHLPLPRSEGATYNWQYGYNGVDPSAAIFTYLPSIARGLDLPLVSDALSGLSLIFHKPYASNHAVILKMLQDFNVKYIILHKDIEWLGGELYNPLETERILGSLEFLEKKEIFGDLTIYKLKTGYFKPKVILSDNVELLYPSFSNSKKNLFWPWMIASQSADLVTITEGKDDGRLIKSLGSLLFPQDSFNYKEAPATVLKATVDNLINDPNFTSPSPLNQLIQIRNLLIQQTKDTRSIEMAQKIITSSQLLLKMYVQQGSSPNRAIAPLQDEYIQLVKDIFKGNLKIIQLIPYSREEDIINIFQIQYFILNELVNKSSSLERPDFQGMLNLLKDYLIRNNLMPKLPLDISLNWNGETQNIQKFQVPYKSDYEILMSDSNVKDIYTNKLSPLNFWVNGKSELLSSKGEGDLLSFGKVELNSGMSEIGYSIITSQNLLPELEKMNKFGDIKLVDKNTIEVNPSDKETSYFDGDIVGVYGGGQYKITFDALVNQGTVFFAQILQDTDSEGKIDPSPLRIGIKDIPVSQFFLAMPNSLWQTYSLVLPSLRSTTQRAKLRIILYSLPGQNSFNTANKVFIKDLKIERILNNSLILRDTSGIGNNLPSLSGEVNSQRVNASLYQGKLKLEKPALLIFKETFYPGWKLELSKEQNTYIPAKHYLANLYANAWLIDKVGDYNFKIKYEPQNEVRLGLLIAALSWTGLILMYIVKLLKFNQKI